MMRRPRAWLVCLLVLVTAGFQQDGRTQAPAAAGQAVVREIAHDFGPIMPGTVLSHTFRVHNTGAAPLHIVRVDATAAGLRSRFSAVVAPGATGDVTLTWAPEGASGERQEKVVVHLSDPRKPRVTLTLSGVLKDSVTLEPSSDVIVTAFPDDRPERRVSVVNHESRPLQVTGVRVTGDEIHADVSAVDPGRRYDIVLRIRSGLAPGRYLADVFVETDHPRLGPLRLTVRTTVRDAIYAAPDVVDFGDIPLERLRRAGTSYALSRSATVATRTGDFAITAVESDVAGLRVDRSPTGRAAAVGLVITLDKERLEPGELKGAIRLRTDDPQFPVIVLPVHGRVR